jgi:hypothetical protein
LVGGALARDVVFGPKKGARSAEHLQEVTGQSEVEAPAEPLRIWCGKVEVSQEGAEGAEDAVWRADDCLTQSRQAANGEAASQLLFGVLCGLA